MKNGKVVWHVTQSLDGYIAGPGGEMSWMFEHTISSSKALEVPQRAGAILGGRVWYDECLERGWDKMAPYGGTWSGPIFVLTHRTPTSSPFPVTFLDCAIEPAIASALEAATGKDVVLFGAGIPAQALDAGLLDEMVVHVVPVLLGDGLRMYDRAGAVRKLARADGPPNAAETMVLRPRVS